jgi:ferredoxin
MDSPFSQNDVESTSSLFDVVFQDALLLLTPPITKPRTTEILIPKITVTQTLLTLLDPNGVVLCAVCKESIYVDEEAKQLPCDHLYHSDCITPWLLLQSSCPLCRFRISEQEEDENDDEDEDDDDVVVGGGVCCERGVDLDLDLDFLGVEASMAILDLHIGRRK